MLLFITSWAILENVSGCWERDRILLLFGGKLCILGPLHLQCCSQHLFSHWSSAGMFYLLLKVQYWSLQQLSHLSAFYVDLSIFVLCIYVFLIVGAYIIVLPLVELTLYYIMTFFVSSDNFWLKVYLVWYKYSHTCSLLVINSVISFYLSLILSNLISKVHLF